MTSRWEFGLALVSALIACNVRQGEAGPNGDDDVGDPGPPGAPSKRTPTITTLAPARVHVGRQVEVLVSGADTSWSEESELELNFGPGITASETVIASPTGLRTLLDIGPDADLGPRTVRIRQGDDVAASTTVFVVDPSLETYPLGGSTQLFESPFQGSIVQGVGIQIDPSTPFDPVLTNLDVTIGEGSRAYATYTLDLEFGFFLEVDVKAEPGPRRVSVASGPPGAVVESVTAYEAVKVVERTPTPLALGPNPDVFVVPDASRLYAIPVGGESKLFTFEVSSDDPMARADVVVLPSSGKFSEALRRVTKQEADTVRAYAIATADADVLYLVYRGFQGGSGYDFTIDVREQPTTEMTLLSTPFAAGAIEEEGESDWFTFEGEAGSEVRLEVESSGAVLCASAQNPDGIDSEIELVDASGVSLSKNDDLGAANYCSELSVVLPSTGVYYVRVASSRVFAPTGTFAYQLAYEEL